MIVMPADHVIEPAESFRATVRAAVAVIEDDPSALVTFGIKPTHPETGYGYIERGQLLEDPRRHPRPPGRPVPREARPRHGREVPGRRQLRLELGDLRLASPDDPGRDPGPSPAGWPRPRADPAWPSAPRTRPRPWRGSSPSSSACRSTRPSWNTQPTSACSRSLTTGTTSATGALWPASSSRDSAGNAIQGDVIARDTTGSIIDLRRRRPGGHARRRRPGRRPLRQGDAGRQEGPARQAQGPGRRTREGWVSRPIFD